MYRSVPKMSLNSLCMLLYFAPTVKCRNVCVSCSYRHCVARMGSCPCRSISVTVTYFGEPKVTKFLIEDIQLCFNTQKLNSFIPSKQQLHTIISTLVWLHVSVFSRPSSVQYFPIEGTISAHYTLWDPILFTGSP